ncbi:hypothetical protein F4680DRAFT_427954 [Xylaria scruposa]|nr:hypothetical protein F4680DRAFT_427954 [Xylaria scruposa]
MGLLLKFIEGKSLYSQSMMESITTKAKLFSQVKITVKQLHNTGWNAESDNILVNKAGNAVIILNTTRKNFKPRLRET